MYRSTLRAGRYLPHSSSSLVSTRIAGRRYLSTDAPHLRSRGWRNSALRWGLAAAGIYYYNTSPVFAELPQSNLLNPNVDAIDDGRDHPTLDQLTASSRNKAQKDASTLQSVIESTSEDGAAQQVQKPSEGTSLDQSLVEDVPTAPGGPEGAAALEEEAEGEGAFNPVTGEINWDCPCLGGMAYGPCGEEFRTAFSCFVYSTQEPKGMDCVDKFQGMQDCFRAHPEVYKGEIDDDEALDDELAKEREELKREIEERRTQVKEQTKGRNLLEEADTHSSTPAETGAEKKDKSRSKKTGTSTKKTPESQHHSQSEHGASSQTIPQPKPTETRADVVPESEILVPKASYDATEP